MIEFIVCDDNHIIRENVEKVINSVMMKNELAYEIKHFDDYNSAFFEMMNHLDNSKIYILDIEVTSLSGIDVARMIRKKDKQSSIIFLTTHDELGYTLLTSRLNFLTFISKFDDYRSNLTESIKEAIKYIGVKRTLDFVDRGVQFSIPINNILYVCRDTYNRKSIIKTDNNEYKIYISLSNLEKKLGDNFKRTHRACIVNNDRVEGINYVKQLIYFDNGQTIDLVSKNYMKELV